MLLDACHAAESNDEPFDYVAFLEDDILLTDPDFFLKLRCFNRAFGDQYLLMPNRIETMERQGQLRRFYIDGDYNPAVSEAYRRSQDQMLCFPHLGEMVRFDQPSTFIPAVFFSTAIRPAAIPVVAMPQWLIRVFMALWRVRPPWACSRHSS